MSQPDRTFWESVWHDIKPVIVHTIAVTVLLLCVLVVGLTSKLLVHLVGENAHAFCKLLDHFDSLVMSGALCFYAMVTFITLVGLLLECIWSSWIGTAIKAICRKLGLEVTST